MLARLYTLQSCQVRQHAMAKLVLVLSGYQQHEFELHAGHASCAAALVAAGASLSKTCESSPVLHLAVCLGAQPSPARSDRAEELVKLLLKSGADSDAK